MSIFAEYGAFNWICLTVTWLDKRTVEVTLRLNGFMFKLEGVSSVANFITAYEESQ